MNSTGPRGSHVSPRPKEKELDSMKESISDIINQLQDIDPSRLSFSPFLDLDTQISLAPVSDSPESSVEELHSSRQSMSGSTPTLEPNAQHKSLPRNYQHLLNNNTLPKECLLEERPAGQLSPVAGPENCTSAPRWSPDLASPGEEARPLISSPPESVELTVWNSERNTERRPVPDPEPDLDQDCCCRCCKCCQSGRVPTCLSVLASLLCAAGIMFALYFFFPLKEPIIMTVPNRLVFALCCCSVAAVPILLAMTGGALCQFCRGTSSLRESLSPRWSVHRLFISSSLELLLLYTLNLSVMAALVPAHSLKLVPVIVVMFILGRLVYWVSLNVCSHWRGFGSGLTIFPLLLSLGLNIFFMFIHILFGWY